MGRETGQRSAVHEAHVRPQATPRSVPDGRTWRRPEARRPGQRRLEHPRPADMPDWESLVNEYTIVPSAAARLTGRALGIDVGGSGIKAAVVDVASGQLVTERIRERTPRRATPEALLGVVVDVVRRLEATGVLTPDLPAGAGFPSVIRAGQALTATQLNRSWIGAPVQEMLGQRLRRPMVVLNDADAAGVGENGPWGRPGAARRRPAAGPRDRHRLGALHRRAANAQHAAGTRRVPMPRRRVSSVARGAHPTEDRLEEVGR